MDREIISIYLHRREEGCIYDYAEVAFRFVTIGRIWK